jgi:hypothetical protein
MVDLLLTLALAPARVLIAHKFITCLILWLAAFMLWRA